MNKSNFVRRMDRAIISRYEKYLENSEDQATSPMREDTYVNGFRDACLWFVTDLRKQLIKEEKEKENVKRRSKA